MSLHPLWPFDKKWTPEHGDALFDADGSVRLPRMVGIAVSMAVYAIKAGRPSKALLTRQATHAKAEAVQAALGDRLSQCGYETEIRPSSSGESFGLYVVDPARDTPTTLVA